jgi:hypothetical protein
MIFLFRTREKCAINFVIVSDESHRKISHTQEVTTVKKEAGTEKAEISIRKLQARK